MFNHWRRIFAPMLLCLVLFLTGCNLGPPPSRYAEVQKETTQRNAAPAVAKDATQGGQFNKFFPKGGAGYQVVAAQEKKGFAEYKVNKDGKNVATIAITDTTSIPGSADKFKASEAKIAGFPTVEKGANSTEVLVSDRYKVTVSSKDPSFTQADRKAWIQKVNLTGLSSLKS
jgi:hypothetical protein